MHFWSPSDHSQQDQCHQGEAEIRILNFKTTWSEFQRASQTATERGEAELRILNFISTWSEFQKPSQTPTERGEAELRILYFKTTWSEFQKASQGFYLAENLRFTPVFYHLPSVGPKQLCALAHLGCTCEAGTS